jgi:hypothetical protein
MWVAVNALLGCASWKVGRRLSSSESSTMIIVHSLVLYWALVTGAAFGLGVGGVLSGRALLLTGTVLALGLLYGAGKGCAPIRSQSEASGGDPAVRARGPVGRSGGGERYWLGAWAFLLAAWCSLVCFGGFLDFPSDWDSLMYHMPLIDQWLHARSLYAPDAFLWSNPASSELMGLWAVGPFSGDFLIALTNLPAVALLGLGTVELAGALGLNRSLCHAAGLIVVANSVVPRQLVDAENDVATAAFFVTCLCYGVRYARSLRLGDLAFGSVCLGLLAGTKFYALGYAGALWCTGVLFVWLTRGRRPAAVLAMAWALGVVALAGYWYLRNTWVTGSPFYPKGLPGTEDPLSEVHPDFFTSSFLGNRRPELLPLALQAVETIAGPCHLAAFVGIPLQLAWLVVSGARRFRCPGGEVDGAARWALALLLVLSGLVLAVTPFAVENEPGTLNFLRGGYLPVRFAMCFLALAVVALTVVLHDLSLVLATWASRGSSAAPWYRAGGGAALQAALGCAVPALLVGAAVLQQASTLFRAFQQTALEEGALLALNLWTIGLGLVLLGGSSPRVRRAVTGALGAAVLAGSAWGAGWLAERWHSGFAPAYDRLLGTEACSSLAERVAGATRLCVLDYRHYPFFGSDRRFRVCQPFRVPSYPWLVEYLRARDVTTVVVLNRDFFTYGRFHGVRWWLEEHSDVFEPVEESEQVSVFRVRPEQPGSVPAEPGRVSLGRPPDTPGAGLEGAGRSRRPTAGWDAPLTPILLGDRL